MNSWTKWLSLLEPPSLLSASYMCSAVEKYIVHNGVNSSLIVYFADGTVDLISTLAMTIVSFWDNALSATQRKASFFNSLREDSRRNVSSWNVYVSKNIWNFIFDSKIKVLLLLLYYQIFNLNSEKEYKLQRVLLCFTTQPFAHFTYREWWANVARMSKTGCVI